MRDGMTLPGAIFLIFCFDVLFSFASLFLVSLTAFRLWLHHRLVTDWPFRAHCYCSRHILDSKSLRLCCMLFVRVRKDSSSRVHRWEFWDREVSGFSPQALCSMVFLRRECLHWNSMPNATPRERRSRRLSWRKRQLQAWRWPPTRGHRSPPSPLRRTPCTSSTATGNWHLHLYLYCLLL